MKNQRFDTITIIGVGLLGGSLGLAIKQRGLARRIIGVGHRQSSLDEALAVGAVDEITLDPTQGAAPADLVIVCTPVGRFKEMFSLIAPVLKRRAIVTDVGSTKVMPVRLGEKILGDAFVGSHPIAGSEQRGAAAARADLFENKLSIVCETARTNAKKSRKVQDFWREIGMNVIKLGPAAHDKALARVSHLPHALAALLVYMQNDADLALCGTGFLDFTRIASGDPTMWRDIFLSNSKMMLNSIRSYQKQLDRLHFLIADDNSAGLEKLLLKAQTRRNELVDKRRHSGEGSD